MAPPLHPLAARGVEIMQSLPANAAARQVDAISEGGKIASNDKGLVKRPGLV
jgi:hypothetical protein